MTNIGQPEVIKVLLVGFFSFLISFALTPVWTRFLYEKKLWKKKVREKSIDGKELQYFKKHHAQKEVGTPRMGGVLVWAGPSVLVLILGILASIDGFWAQKLYFLSRGQTWLAFFALLSGAFLGMIDDLLVVSNLGKYIGGGLSLKRRLLIVALIGMVGAWWFYFKLEQNSVFIPFLGDIYIGWLYPLLFVIVTLAVYSSGVIDGLDGLSGGTFAMIFASYGVIALSQLKIDLASFCFAIAGSLLAFLWFNIPPARFYMGETGIVALTLALTVVAFATNGVAVLPIIGSLLVAETGSVIIQLLSKKYRGKKVFLSAPIHHHFEALGWPSYKVVMRFWVIGAVSGFLGVALRLIG